MSNPSFISIELVKSITVILDLEFYAPENARKCYGQLSYNPWNKDCLLLGGCFLTLNGTNAIKSPLHIINQQIEGLWLWQNRTERELVEKILTTLQQAALSVRKVNKGRRSAVLCGIGITTSDVLVLFELFKRYKLLTNVEAFELMNSFRIVDLSQVAIPFVKPKTGTLYPAIKDDLMHRYLNGESFESGREVWDMYERGHFDVIQRRCQEEVLATYRCYMGIHQEIRKVQSLMKKAKRKPKTRQQRSEE